MRPWNTEPVDDAAVATLATALGVPSALARALWLRGVHTADGANGYFNPRLADVSDPSGIAGMTEAVERIWRAIEDGEAITAFGDFDVDGVTGATVLTRVLRQLGAKIQAFVPRRVEDGYGLTHKALDRCIASTKPALIITADCGITAVEPVAEATRRGVDVIVTDHHEYGPELPKAVALVHPKLGCPPGAAWLSGVGVAFKLCYALVRRAVEKGRAAKDEIDLRDLLGLVAIGTVADVAPLLGENRVFVAHGLTRISKTSLPGLRALVDVAKLNDAEISTHHLGFQLAPRINAAGRMGDAFDAVNLLLSEDDIEAPELARKLDRANQERRKVEEVLIAEALEDYETRQAERPVSAVVVGRPGWHIGTIGVVASRLCSRFGKPVVIIGFGEAGEGRGSCRSVEGFDMVGALTACATHLTKYGGHKMAAGLSLRQEAFPAFQEAFEAVSAERLSGREDGTGFKVDGWLELDEINGEMLGLLKKMTPFGEGNPKPLWGLRGLQVNGTPRILKERHLKFAVSSTGRRRGVPAIAFGMGDRVLPDGPIDVLAHVEENDYMGVREIQLNIQDFRPADGTPSPNS